MANEHIDGPTVLELRMSELQNEGKSITVDQKFAVGELKVTKNQDGSIRLKFSGR